MHAISALVTRARRAHPVRRVLLAGLSLSLATLAACGGGGDGGSTGPAETGRGKIRVSNASNVSAWYVYVKSCTSTAWGADRLGAEVLSPGESATLNIDAGCYDLRAESSPTNARHFEQRGFQVGNDQTTQITIASWQND